MSTTATTEQLAAMVAAFINGKGDEERRELADVLEECGHQGAAALARSDCVFRRVTTADANVYTVTINIRQTAVMMAHRCRPLKRGQSNILNYSIECVRQDQSAASPGGSS